MILDSISVVNTPGEGFQGVEFLLGSALRSNISILLIVAFLFLAFTLRHGFKYFHTLLEAPFSVRNRENIYEHRTMNETFVLIALFLNTAIQCGILLLFAAANFLNIQLAQIDFTSLCICVFAIAIYMFVQYLLYKILCYTFGNPNISTLVIGGLNSTWALFGLTIVPITIAITFHDFSHFHLIMAAFILFIIFKIILAVKVFRIFFANYNVSLLFLLYLCALEIVPFVIFSRVAIYFCDYLHI